MKGIIAVIALVLVAIAVALFMIAGNTSKSVPAEQQPWQWMCSQQGSGCNN